MGWSVKVSGFDGDELGRDTVKLWSDDDCKLLEIEGTTVLDYARETSLRSSSNKNWLEVDCSRRTVREVTVLRI